MKKSKANTQVGSKQYPEQRKAPRRGEGGLAKRAFSQYKELLQVGQIITSEIHFDVLFDLIIEQTNKIMDVERCSIFLIDENGEMLNTFVSAGVGRLAIQIPKTEGIVGWVFNNRKPAIVNNVYEDPRFYTEVDKKSELQTNAILCVPLVNRNTECIGALEIINCKKGEFTKYDCEILIYLSNYITIALENAMLYRELKVMDRAKERVIDHLAHELSTPIALLGAVIGGLSKSLKKYQREKAEKFEERGNRNIKRLMDLRDKATDIVKYKSVGEKDFLIKLITEAASVIEDLIEEGDPANNKIFKKIHNRIESIYRVGETKIEKIIIEDFIEDIIEEVSAQSYRPGIELHQKVDASLTLNMDKNVLWRILFGLLKNAIENTPDEGNIEIKAYATDKNIAIDCVDHGIGITRENQRQIFGGFYHTQQTDLYSTKKPFEFNAGGAGIDLLRAKILSDRLGFQIDFVSKRCNFILLDSDQCPGKISMCKHIKDKSECYHSGGSTFSIKFPLN